MDINIINNNKEWLDTVWEKVEKKDYSNKYFNNDVVSFGYRCYFQIF